MLNLQICRGEDPPAYWSFTRVVGVGRRRRGNGVARLISCLQRRVLGLVRQAKAGGFKVGGQLDASSVGLWKRGNASDPPFPVAISRH